MKNALVTKLILVALLTVAALPGKAEASRCRELSSGNAFATMLALNLLLDANQDIRMVSSRTGELRAIKQVLTVPRGNGYTISVLTSDNQWEVLDIGEIRVMNMTTNKSVDLGAALQCNAAPAQAFGSAEEASASSAL